MMSNNISNLRFHGRSLSARDPPIIDSQNEYKFEGYKQPRLLPNTPNDCLDFETNDDEHYFIQNSMKFSNSSLSPSEERIRRKQKKNNKVSKAGSSPRLGTGRLLPIITNLCTTTKQSSRSSPENIHLSSCVYDNSFLHPSNNSNKNINSKRLDFRRAHQLSMGQVDSRVNNRDSTRFSSFDATNSYGYNVTQKTKPRRFDSTASEDSVLSTEHSDDKSVGKFGSSGSLDNSLKTKVKPIKKHSADDRSMQRSQRSASTSKTNLKSTMINGAKISTNKRLPPISSSSQAIILYCMENARGDIASRVIGRMAHKRDDFASFCSNMNGEQWNEFLSFLRNYLNDVVAHIQSAEKIREISIQFGTTQVPRRAFGFKADYFAVMADALTTECVFLDGAAHQPTEAIEAWAELVELMFSNVRDGYYQQIRFLRKNSQCFNGMFSRSSDQSTDSSDHQASIPVAPSTSGTLVRQYSEMSISPKHSTSISSVQTKFY